MTRWRLVLRSLAYRWRTHLGALVGAAVSSAILTGALLVGDSVRGSLRAFALARLGRVQMALDAGDRMLRKELGSEMSRGLGRPVAGLLRLSGTATAADGAARANHIQVLGVDRSFWELAPETPALGDLPRDTVVLNDALASHLRVRVGDNLVVRVPKPSRLSPEAPLAPTEGTSLALRLTVHAVVNDAQFGRFGLQASQVPPYNAFVSLPWLGELVGSTNRVNLLLAGGEPDADLIETTASALRRTWSLADAELVLRPLPAAQGSELRSGRIFLEPAVGRTALAAHPRATGILTYLVNELRSGTRATPYSMVTAMSHSVMTTGLGDDELAIAPWLAEDLQVAAGDVVELAYYTVGLARQLQTRTNRFRVARILPAESPGADPTLMPDFPGLSGAASCREWDAGFPIKAGAIRDKDEQYWSRFRGTPKAFMRLDTGQRIWANRFGDLTAVRFPPDADPAQIGQTILEGVGPQALGLGFQPVRAQAIAASNEALDFGQLFLGFSFFLLAAAVLLMTLLFYLGVEQRALEVGTLLALGFEPALVRRLLLAEGAVLAALGASGGALTGVAYAQAMLHGLNTIWRDAVGTAGLAFHGAWSTAALGASASVAVAVAAMALSLRHQARQSALTLLARGSEETTDQPTRARGLAPWIGTSALALAAALGGWTLSEGNAGASGNFFGCGALLLAAGLAWSAWALRRLADTRGTQTPSTSRPGPPEQPATAGVAGAARLSELGLAVRNASRRRKRSLATVALLACGTFIVAAIGVFRLESPGNAHDRAAGTGGFAWIGESALPVVQDLNTAPGREAFGLEDAELRGVEVVSLRVRAGDDASCLNLNRAQRPRLLGIRAEELARRGAFRFAQVMAGLPQDKPWRLLQMDQAPAPAAGPQAGQREIPAIGDQASILWALGKKVGDTLAFEDERGRPFRVRIVAAVANSVLQGSLLIDEAAFVALFPGEPGYRMFLIDAPPERAQAIGMRLGRALQDVGLELTPAARRLAAFNAIQNTYLSTFQILGGMGLVLGTVGLGVIVVRNVLERRGELALLLAVGFRQRQVRRLVSLEHGLLLIAGLGLGAGAASIAVLPTLLAPGATAPPASLYWLLLAVGLNGAAWTWGAVVVALRGELLNALRAE